MSRLFFLIHVDAAKHVLSMLGCSALSKADENGRDLEDQSAAAVGIDVEPEDVLMLKVVVVLHALYR